MKQLVLHLLLFIFIITGKTYAQGDTQPPPDAIPITFTNVPPHLLSTQFNFSAGAGRIAHNDEQLLSGCAEVKGLYNITGALYVSSGISLTYLRSQGRQNPDKPQTITRDAVFSYLPSGIGF